MSSIIRLSDVVDESMFKDDEPLICKLHDITHENNHVSIACNLARFVRFLRNDCLIYDAELKASADLEYASLKVLFGLYLITERLELVFKAIYYPPEYKNVEFPILSKITRWANFLKHPRTSFFAHVCDGVHAETVRIDDVVIQDLWSGEKKAGKTESMLAGKHIEVIYPSIEDFKSMITELSKVLEDVIHIVNENPKYKEIISDSAVLEKRLEE